MENKVPLHLVVERNKTEAAHLLLAHGANRNVLNNSSKRPSRYTKNKTLKALVKRPGFFQRMKQRWTQRKNNKISS